MDSIALNQFWSATLVRGDAPNGIGELEIPAEVPGTIHTDLLRASLIDDPYWGENERALEWLWRTSWRYSKVFETTSANGSERIELVFEGLDTIATVLLNGVELARTKNMHRSYRLHVTHLVVNGPNVLEVIFSPALDYANQVQNEVGFRPSPYAHPYHAIRKMACSFGWDWGPNLQTAGIWKAVRLERFHTARFDSVRCLAQVDAVSSSIDAISQNGHLEVHLTFVRLTETPLTVTIKVAENEESFEVPAGEQKFTAVMSALDVELWWPRGYGASPLYDVTVDLHWRDELLDRHQCRVGFRQLELDMTRAETGAGFTFVVNGQRLFIKGANWIPDDHLMTRITQDRLRRRIQQAADANMNLLRVWGGGIYESEDFYNLCDEMGILVWQDFPFACAAYHEGSSLVEEVVAEARENVTRLASHASLIIYNGSNENIWGFCDWGWREKIGGDGSWGLKYYEQILPAILTELDPTRPYIPSSPFSPYHAYDQVHPNDPAWGPVHEWEVWNRVDYTHYRDYVPRFCAEFGFQGPATWATLKRSLPTDAFDQEHPAWLLHQKADDGNGKLNRGFAPHLPEPEDFESWHWTTSLNQARAIQFAIEHYRSWWPQCAGAIVWQLNDCWPVTSWAAIDGDERKKPLWFALKHAYAPRLLTIQPRAADGTHDAHGVPHLVMVNETSLGWKGSVTFTRMSLQGQSRANTTLEFVVEPWQAHTIAIPRELRETDAPSDEVLVAEVGTWAQPDHVRTLWFFAEDKHIAYAKRAFVACASKCETGYEITVKAFALVRNLTLLADKVDPDAEVDDALVDLLAGETHTFCVSSKYVVDPRAFVSPRVLVSVGSLGHSAPAANCDGPL